MKHFKLNYLNVLIQLITIIKGDEVFLNILSELQCL